MNEATEISRGSTETNELNIVHTRPMLLVAAIVVIILGILTAWFVADTRTKKSAEARAEEVLLDSAVEQTYTLSAMIDGQYRLLDAFSEHIADHCGVDRELITDMLSTISEKTKFSHIRYIDAKGIMYVNGDTTNVWGRSYFQKSLNGEKGLQYVIVRGLNMPAVALSVPYKVNGEICGVICGWMDEENLEELLMSKAYGGSSYSMLVNSEGKALIYSDSEYMLQKNGSLAYLEYADFDDGFTYQGIITKMKSGEDFTFRYTYDGIRRVVAAASMSRTGLPDNDWFVINAVSREFLEAESAIERKNSLELLKVVMTFGAGAVVLILLYKRQNTVAQEKSAEELRRREECFRIAASQTGRFVFRYDIASGTYYHITGYDGSVEQPMVVENFVESIIEQGVIATESVAAYREFFKMINAGETPPDVDIRLAQRGGGMGWYRFSATLVLDSAGRATTAVVSYVDCSEQREREMAYSRWRQEMDDLPSKNTVLLEWNITKNIFESERGDARVSPGQFANASFDEVAGIYARRYVVSEDRQAYLALVNRAHLLGMYHSNSTNAELDYREVLSGGGNHWMRLTVRLVMYPTSTDIKAYIAAMDVDDEKRAELSLIAKSEIDPLTGAYNRGTFVDKVKALLARDPEGPHAIMMLDIDDFKSMNDTFGHDFGDKLLQSIPKIARSELRSYDFIGRIGGDEFMICLANVAGMETLSGKAGALVKAFSKRVSDTEMATVSIGASVYPKDGTTVEELYKKADVAMYTIKRSGKNDSCFYKEGMGESGNVPTSFDK